MSDMNTSESSNRWGELIDQSPQQVVQIALLGIGIGVLVWLVTLLVRQVVLVPLFCGDPTSGACVGATSTAGNVATIIAGLVGLLGLVRLSVYRPLLVVIASAIALWGIGDWVSGLAWFEAIAWIVLLYAICYVAFSWLVRPRAMVPVLIVLLVVVILARWLPSL